MSDYNDPKQLHLWNDFDSGVKKVSVMKMKMAFPDVYTTFLSIDAIVDADVCVCAYVCACAIHCV